MTIKSKQPTANAFPSLPRPVNRVLEREQITTDEQLRAAADRSQFLMSLRDMGSLRISLVYEYLAKRFPDQAYQYYQAADYHWKPALNRHLPVNDKHMSMHGLPGVTLRLFAREGRGPRIHLCMHGEVDMHDLLDWFKIHTKELLRTDPDAWTRT